MKRQVFIISDGTGLTAESLANSLLTQFDSIQFDVQTIPYVDDSAKADSVKQIIQRAERESGCKPIVFITIVNPEISNKIKASNACILDIFNTFLAPLETELDIKSSYAVGKTHSLSNTHRYDQRIEAVNYTLAHDDGIKVREYDQADVILVGVSRSGKTPTCLYMALQFGILAANYPLTDDELLKLSLPESLHPFKNKLFGLSIDPLRLHQIRSERRPGSQYASFEQCRLELSEIEALFQQENIPFINTTKYSIEEIATKILAKTGLKRKLNS
tara:strand:- start:1157 stop:1978 length:822 start_codon:yes stop_codon:yes gene_type:complete